MIRERLAAAGIFLASIAACNPTSAPMSAGTSSAAPPAASTSASAIATSSASATTSDARRGSTIARSPEGDALFVADEDHGVVRGLALPLEANGARSEIAMPGPPAQLVVRGRRVLVTIRDAGGHGGALVVLERSGAFDLVEKARVALPADAWGLATTADGALALVSSAWTHALSAIDLRDARVLWTADVAREPRGIAITSKGDRAYVTHLVGNGVTRVDDLAAATPKLTRIDLGAAPLRSSPGARLDASNGTAVALSPDDDRAYFPRHAFAALGAEAWFGSTAVDVLLTAGDVALAPAKNASPPITMIGLVDLAHAPWNAGATPAVEVRRELPEPRAIVYRAKTRTLLVASEGEGIVAELDALATDPMLATRQVYALTRKGVRFKEAPENGGAPNGIALSADESRAWVFCRSTYDVAEVELAPDDGTYRELPPLLVKVADDPSKDADVTIGRRLFYSSKGHLSGGVACAGCHPEGRDDGHVWHEIKLEPEKQTGEINPTPIFLASADVSALEARWGKLGIQGSGVGYARQTPMIAGRVRAAGPYGWHGESADLPSRIAASFRLHRWRPPYEDDLPHERALAGYLAAYLRKGLSPPPMASHPPTDEEARGKAIFESPKVECTKCHAGADTTDRAPTALGVLPPPAGFAQDPNPQYKTPSLAFVGNTPPYLHDGRYETLESLIEGNADRMGKTSHLSADDKKALIAYLRTL